MSEDFRQTDGRFAKGNPGGPGRPRARERAAAVDELAGEAGAELIEVALDAAKEGQPQGGELLLERIWPVRRGRPVGVDAPPVREVADLVPGGSGRDQRRPELCESPGGRGGGARPDGPQRDDPGRRPRAAHQEGG